MTQPDNSAPDAMPSLADLLAEQAAKVGSNQDYLERQQNLANAEQALKAVKDGEYLSAEQDDANVAQARVLEAENKRSQSS